MAYLSEFSYFWTPKHEPILPKSLQPTLSAYCFDLGKLETCTLLIKQISNGEDLERNYNSCIQDELIYKHAHQVDS